MVRQDDGMQINLKRWKKVSKPLNKGNYQGTRHDGYLYFRASDGAYFLEAHSMYGGGWYKLKELKK